MKDTKHANQQVLTSYMKMLETVKEGVYLHELNNLEEMKRKYSSFKHYMEAMEIYDKKHNVHKKP